MATTSSSSAYTAGSATNRTVKRKYVMYDYVFMTTSLENKDSKADYPALLVLKNQTDQNGNKLSESVSVGQYPVSFRDTYPRGTIFCSPAFNVQDRFYVLEANEIYVLADQLASELDKKFTEDMINQWIEYQIENELLKKDEKKGESLVEKIKRDKPAPTIEKDGYYLDPDTWVLLNRNVEKEVPMLLLGPTGSGKTQLASLLASANAYDMELFNIGSMSDAASNLQGVHRLVNGESVFELSRFAKTIGQKNKFIVLDELPRGPYETNNYLFPLLDGTKTLMVDVAHEDSARQIALHKGNVLFATGNVGNEYTGNSVIDRALLDRLFLIEIPYLPKKEETEMLKKLYSLTPKEAAVIVEIAATIRMAATRGDLSTSLSVRYTKAVGEMVMDGFEPRKAMELVYFPLFKDERDTIKSMIASK